MSNLTNLLATLLQSITRAPQTTTNIQHSFGAIASYNRNIEDYNRNIEDYNRNIRGILPILQEIVALDTRRTGALGSADAEGTAGSANAQSAEGTAQSAEGTAQSAEGTTQSAEGTAQSAEGTTGTAQSAEGTAQSAEGTTGTTWDQNLEHQLNLVTTAHIPINNEHAYYYLAALFNLDLSGANIFSEPENRGLLENVILLNTTQYNYVEPIPALEEPELCSITMEPLTNETPVIKITRCGHVFKSAALITWFQNHNTCPLCRQTAIVHLDE
jgi:hypothetical protein